MKYLLSICFLIFFCHPLWAQDTIIQKNGNRVPAKVLQIDKNDVTYKKFENPDGPSYVIPKSDINVIRYQNGSTDTFNLAVSAQKQVKFEKTPKSEMFLKGEQDAAIHYTKFKPAGHWSFGLTLPLNAIGVIPAVIMSATEPKRENLDYPDVSLLTHPDYVKGYLTKAKDKKGKHVMKNFAFGCIGSFVIYGSIILLSK
jgi:hypothetical protein